MKTFFTAVCLLFAGLLSVKLQAQNSSEGARPAYKSIYEMLRGLPGLEVKLDNKGGGTVVVRGTGSLMAQRPPLFVVDGAIYGGDVSNINPQEVENITVLKDAASATAYGSQGAAGVIQITMKRGTAVSNQPAAAVVSHGESAYTYFIEHKTKLKVIGQDDKVIIEGVIQEQRGESLVFRKKKTELLVPIKDIKKVEMVAADE